MSRFRNGPVAPGIAFITGGARGIGNSIACSFAKEGSKGVALIDICDEEGFKEGKANVEKYGTECITIRADVTKEDQVKSAVEQTVERFGRMITQHRSNFAGIIGPLQNVWETDLADWQKTLDVNMVGLWLCNKYELKQMLKQDSVAVEEGRPAQQGSIVNCASVNSIQAAATASAYTASKHAVMGITKVAALEARSHNIRVNAVSPGFLATRLFESAGHDLTGTVSAGWDNFVGRQGREAHPDEVGDVVVLLSTPRMSLVNGHNLVIDGGFTINELSV